MSAGFETVGTYIPDNLIAGDFPQNFEKVTLKGGRAYKRGELLGRITADKKHVLSARTDGNGDPVADGSEAPRAILVDDVDAAGGDAEGLVYLSGTFDTRSVILGGGHTADSVKDGLRDKGIWLVKTTA